jgi:2-polyprenyl-3-methyl-5-hydroxy-6-metoxy-1,4-benzoquinol methylase
MDITEQKYTDVRRHPWELARFEILLELINTCIPRTNERKFIADIGCGDCFFAQQLLKARQDVEIIGLDTAYSTEDIIQKNKELGEPRFHLYNSLDELPSPLKEESVRLILLLDVMEHVEKDREFLQQITQSINGLPDVKILISVPAYQGLYTGHDVFLKHYRRYTRKSINQTVISAGLAPLLSGYFFFSLLPIRFFQKLAEKTGMLRKQKGVGGWQGDSFISKLFKNYLLFDYQFSKLLGKAGISLPGLSAYCICKKPAS